MGLNDALIGSVDLCHSNLFLILFWQFIMLLISSPTVLICLVLIVLFI
jgi:hypothetical protein